MLKLYRKGTYRAEKSVRALMQLTAPHARVIRDGKEHDIESRALVPGDVVLLESGVRVPADIRLFQATALQVDESMLTGESEWREMPLTHPYAEQYRSLGLAEMIRAIHEGRPNRLNGQLAYHVLDIMLAFNDSSASGAHVRLESPCTPPAPMPTEGL